MEYWSPPWRDVRKTYCCLCNISELELLDGSLANPGLGQGDGFNGILNIFSASKFQYSITPLLHIDSKKKMLTKAF